MNVAENRGTSAVAMSLADAFTSGKPWTPSFHMRWLAEHNEIAGDIANAGPPADTTPDSMEVNADELFKALIDFKNRAARFEQGHEGEQSTKVILGLRGVTAHNLIVTGGPLDLTSIVFPTPLDFSGCSFPEGVILDNARLGPVSLNGASTPFLHADAVRIDGDFDLHFLQDAKWIDLRGGEIAGCLYLYDCYLNKGKDPALDRVLRGDGLSVKASVFLSNGFVAEGEVNLIRATIGGRLTCVGGRFRNPGKIALHADAVTVRADVFLCDGFVAEGGVSLRGATIGGQLACIGGTFRSPGKTALNAGAVTVQADVFLCDGFVAEGEVDLHGATIGGKLACDNGTFRNPGKTALNAGAATIKASAFLRNGFVAEGEVNLIRATIGGLLSCYGGTFHNPGKMALDAAAITVQADVFLCDGFVAEGEVSLIQATIGGQLTCDSGTFRNPGKTALYADAITVHASVFLRDGFVAEGKVNLRGATIGGQLSCDGGTFRNPGKTALYADAITVQADVFLRDGFVAEGEVDFCRANISGNLRCCEGSFTAPVGDVHYAALDLSGAQIGRTLSLTRLDRLSGRLDLRSATAQNFADDGSAWPKKGELWLDGFHYDNFTDDWATVTGRDVRQTPTDFESRCKWLMLQPASDLRERLKPQPWTQCANVMLAAGNSRDARMLLYARDRLWLKTKQPGWLTKFFLGGVMRVLAGYGYKSHYAFFWALSFLVAGWMIFGAAYDKGLIWRIDQTDNSRAVEVFHPFAYTLDTFLPGIRLGETAIWGPYGKAEAIRSLAAQYHATRALAPIECPSISNTPKVLAEYLPAICKAMGAAQTPMLTGVDWALDAGLARVWLWVETVMGWLLFGVLAAGLTGILQRKVE